MYAAAAQSGMPPRRYSFTRVRHVVEHFPPFIAAAQTPEEAQALTDKMTYCVGQKKLRNRMSDHLRANARTPIENACGIRLKAVPPRQNRNHVPRREIAAPRGRGNAGNVPSVPTFPPAVAAPRSRPLP